MRDRIADFGDDTDIVLVTFTDPANISSYRERHGLDAEVEVVIDRDRAAYTAFGLERGSVARIWGWRAALRYAQILRSDGFAGLRRPTEDTLQLGGDFIVDPNGTLVYGFWGDGPDDRPDVDELVAALGRGTAPD